MAHICNPIAKEKCTIDTILRCPHLNMLSINPNTKQITFSFDTYGDVLDIFFILNSKTRIKLIDVNMTINDKTATIKYNISDTAIGLLLISGNIGAGVFFSIVINYGTKWSMKLLSFAASNTDTSSIVINSGLGRITFNGNSKLESSYEVNGLLLG